MIEISKKQLKESNIILGGTVLYTPAIPELVYLAYENVRNLIQYNWVNIVFNFNPHLNNYINILWDS